MEAGKYMKEKVNVTGVPETMVQTLYARAKETKKKNAKINDEIAVELVKKLDYDFSKADKDKAMSCGVIARTIVLDRMVRQYLEKHEKYSCCKYCMWTGYQMLPDEGKISEMVQRGSAGDYEDKAAVSSRNRSDISDCKVCNG